MNTSVNRRVGRVLSVTSTCGHRCWKRVSSGGRRLAAVARAQPQAAAGRGRMQSLLCLLPPGVDPPGIAEKLQFPVAGDSTSLLRTKSSTASSSSSC